MESFVRRHIGPRPHELPEMLATIGAPSLDALIDEAIPAAIRRPTPLALPDGESEHEYLTRLAAVAKSNRVLRSFIGLGYYDTITPSVIRRCLFENPSWYTPYTPYQAEIAQGRLESLLNFQTVVTDLTGLPVAGASLLDEATAAGEAMTLLHRVSPKKPADGGVFLVSDRVFPQTLAVLQSRAEPLGITLHVGRSGHRGRSTRRRCSARSCSTRTTTAPSWTSGRSSPGRTPPRCWSRWRPTCWRSRC